MNERRRFSSSERIALYLAADGRCQRCGAELAPGWHSDHEQPWSKGGTTDVVNGQALCPKCNLKKGATYMPLRDWQEEALRQFVTRDDDFLCVATPGAGKTKFALAAAQQLMDRGNVRRLIVVVPTRHLRRQWQKVAASEFGIQLDPDFENRYGAPARDFDGIVVTYGAVASQPLIYRRLSAREPTLVVLDEIHHAGEPEAWGTRLRQAFEQANRRLLLSGTPFRTSGDPIPFVRYDRDNVAQGDVQYDYGRALTDQVVRPISFPAFDGMAQWRSAGEVESAWLSEADEETVARALVTALDPDGEWIASVLRQADAELSRQRDDVPDAGGLVVAADQFKARRYADLLEVICGEPATVAISDFPDASDRITEFASGRSRWIVAVQMVSEGVDIPRLAVGVYASDYKTQLFFYQVVGRFIRLRGDGDETNATLYVPSVKPIIGYAAEIERTVIPALRDAEERARREAKSGQASLLLDLVSPGPLWEPVSASEATHYATYLSGESFVDEELRRAEDLRTLCGLPASWKAEQIARLLRYAGAGQKVGTAQVQVQVPTTPLADEKRPLRKEVNRKVNQLARLRDTPYRYIHADLNRACEEPNIKAATVETLKRRIYLLDQWLREP